MSNTSNELILSVTTKTMTKFFAQLWETLKTLKLLKLCVSPLWRTFLFGCMLLRAHPRATKPCRLVFEGEGRMRRASSRRIGGFLYVDSSMEGIHERRGHIWERGSFDDGRKKILFLNWNYNRLIEFIYFFNQELR